MPSHAHNQYIEAIAAQRRPHEARGLSPRASFCFLPSPPLSLRRQRGFVALALALLLTGCGSNYHAAAVKSSADDARAILALIDRGLVNLDGPAKQQARTRLETIVDRGAK